MKRIFMTSILSLFLAASIASCRETTKETKVLEKEVEAPKKEGNSVKIKTEGFELEVEDNK